MSKTSDFADVVVVGNGALALFLADELARRDFGSVVVVGPSGRSAGGSQAAGAMLSCFGEITSQTLKSDAGRAKFDMVLSAHGSWPSVLRDLDICTGGEAPLQVAHDTFVVLNTVGAELDSINFAAMTSALQEYAGAWSEVEPCEIPGYNPRTDRRGLRAIHLPSEGAVDARRVLIALEARVRRAGVRVLDQSVSCLLTHSDLITGVRLKDGHVIRAGVVVVAAGAKSEALVRSAIEDLDMMPTFPGLGFAMVGRRVTGKPFRSVVRTPNRAFACGLHVVPLGNGREYLGATNQIAPDVTTAAILSDVWFLSQCAMQQLDQEMVRHEIEQFRTGNRPVALDGFPLIGWLVPSNLYLMTGTYRDGFHCAPLLAAHAADEMQGIEGVVDRMFRPMRRPIVTRTIEDSIEEYVHHSLAAWYETGAQAAPQMTGADLAQGCRAQATRTYARLGIDYALPPDLINHAAASASVGRRIKRFLRL